MKRKVEKFLTENNILPIAIFSSTEAAELKTGYSDPSKFSLDMVMIHKSDYFHVFQDVTEQQYVIQEQRVKSHPFSELPSFIEGMTLCGYDLEFTIKLLDANCRPSESAHVWGNPNPIDLSKMIKDVTGKRYKLFNLAFWNACENASKISHVFQFNKLKTMTDWFNGSKRNIVKKLRSELKWVSQLSYRIIKHKSLNVKDENGKHQRIKLGLEEE